MRRYFVALVLLVIASCSPVQYGQTTTLDVDGYKIGVTPATNRENMWLASHKLSDKVSMFPNDPQIYRRNVRAIESFTGCKVDPVTIDNVTTQTYAAVVC